LKPQETTSFTLDAVNALQIPVRQEQAVVVVQPTATPTPTPVPTATPVPTQRPTPPPPPRIAYFTVNPTSVATTNQEEVFISWKIDGPTTNVRLTHLDMCNESGHDPNRFNKKVYDYLPTELVHRQVITYPSMFILTVTNDPDQADEPAEVSASQMVDAPSMLCSETPQSLTASFDALNGNSIPLSPSESRDGWKHYVVTAGSSVQIQWALHNEKSVTLSLLSEGHSQRQTLSTRSAGSIVPDTSREKIDRYFLEAEDHEGNRLTEQISLQVIQPLNCQDACRRLFLPLMKSSYRETK
jgi:hypothetical protein